MYKPLALYKLFPKFSGETKMHELEYLVLLPAFMTMSIKPSGPRCLDLTAHIFTVICDLLCIKYDAAEVLQLILESHFFITFLLKVKVKAGLKPSTTKACAFSSRCSNRNHFKI